MKIGMLSPQELDRLHPMVRYRGKPAPEPLPSCPDQCMGLAGAKSVLLRISFLDVCDRSLCPCLYFCSTPSTPMAWKSASLRTSARISHGSMLAFQSLSIASLLGYWKIRTRLATLSASMAMALL
jgi:hypothetical protein